MHPIIIVRGEKAENEGTPSNQNGEASYVDVVTQDDFDNSLQASSPPTNNLHRKQTLKGRCSDDGRELP